MLKFNSEIADIARQQIGLFFRARREELGLTTRELAEAANTTPAQVSNFENGKANITINTLLALCGCLRIKPLFESGDVNQVPGFEIANT